MLQILAVVLVGVGILKANLMRLARLMTRSSAVALIWLTVIWGQQLPLERDSVPTFGTTVVVSAGLRGDIYFLPADTEWLPDFKHLKPVGTIYTTRLNIPATDFQLGFPGVTSRFEWFAIDYKGSFWIENKGVYRFGVTSDDGAKLYVDGRLILNNDGIHPSHSCLGAADLEEGVHTLRLSYFQGPRTQLSLSLGIAKSGEPWRVFDTRNFRPPPNSKIWTDANEGRAGKRIGKIQQGKCAME